MTLSRNSLVEQEVPQSQLVVDVKIKVLKIEHKTVKVDLILYGDVDVPQAAVWYLGVLYYSGRDSFSWNQVWQGKFG